ncbi:hypothetical protein EZJ49_09500 [Bdellovibrio bacteriovorus]|uniref:hypothetical protein n=1 Tax=Bdellovibrio bacteriovorus TaxID=959 RepID=UPI0021CFB21A|nr:hypothetical protein [Bdellovibrio bacteriovorus]UXR63308.1 hypothetical protein EZJ49_09500 [Bdellovibrio bacteriovorus]
MKNLMIAATIVLSSLVAKADADTGNTIFPTTIQYENDSDRSVWMTVYNALGLIGDRGCLQPGDSKTFINYLPGFYYEVRVEVKENRDCGGHTLYDMSELRKMNAWYGIYVNIYKKADTYHMSVFNGDPYSPLADEPQE